MLNTPVRAEMVTGTVVLMQVLAAANEAPANPEINNLEYILKTTDNGQYRDV